MKPSIDNLLDTLALWDTGKRSYGEVLGSALNICVLNPLLESSVYETLESYGETFAFELADLERMLADIDRREGR
jgi:hypothetical protein